MNAVDSEFRKNLSSEERPIQQIHRTEISVENSPIAHFGTGNLETLNVPNIYDILLEYYEKNYSANIMSVCLVGNYTLDKLEELAENNFS